MNVYLKISTTIIIATILFTISSCCTGNVEPEKHPSGKLTIDLLHHINGSDINYDTIMYVNQAGNSYLVSEIQYFISDVTLHKLDKTTTQLVSWQDIYYIDTDIGESQTITFKDEIDVGTYDKISFTFGINEDKNNSLMFVNPPESFMFWPENLGGGYHYMKLNGKWINELEQISPFNFHLGIGQIYYQYPDSITGFVQNYFNVEITDFVLEIKQDSTSEIQVVMNVENWFKSPNIYDHNFWGGDIMQNQEAMKQAAENGNNVFSIIKNKGTTTN